MKQKQTVINIWALPSALAIATVVGLVSALFSDGGWGDQLAWLCLGVVAGVSVYFWLRKN